MFLSFFLFSRCSISTAASYGEMKVYIKMNEPIRQHLSAINWSIAKHTQVKLLRFLHVYVCSSSRFSVLRKWFILFSRREQLFWVFVGGSYIGENVDNETLMTTKTGKVGEIYVYPSSRLEDLENVINGQRQQFRNCMSLNK